MPTSGRRRGIVYDLDGTLVDTRKDITQAANHMRGVLGLGPLLQAEVCRFVGLGLRQLVQSCLGTEEPARVEEGMKIYRTHYSAHLLDHTRLYPNVREVLDYFSARTQAVVTNKPNPYSREILTALGVAGYFVEIAAADSGLPKKPDPGAILAILEREGISQEEALLVGDSPIDVEAGSRAGILTVAVAQGFSDRSELEAAKPDELVGDFGELLDLARGRGW